MASGYKEDQMGAEDNRFIYGLEGFDKCLEDAGGVDIYGIGEYGSTVVDYIITSGNKEKIKRIVVTDIKGAPEAYRGIPVSGADGYFRDTGNRGHLVIVAVSGQYQADIIDLLEGFGVKRYLCMTSDAYLGLIEGKDKRPVVPYKGMDFLVAGFVKCGTTSLHRVLRGIDCIYVPYAKETHFFTWFDKVENAEEELVKRYFSNIREGQEAVGAVEPTFYQNAEEIYQYFGPSVKIVLMMRNPVRAAFSLFKMANRCGDPVFAEMYQKYGAYNEDMFENYFERVVKDKAFPFYYDYWIDMFYRYFPKEQVYVCFFEDFIKFPEREMSCILKFIGIHGKYKVSKIPNANEGKFVLKTLEGYKIARQREALAFARKHPFLKVEPPKGRGQDSLQLLKLERAFQKTEKLDLGPDKKVQAMLGQHFHASVRNLEYMLNKDLSGIWF